MATMITKTKFSVLSLFMLLSFSGANAMFDVQSFCKEANSLELSLCLKFIGKDPRIVNARGFRDVLIIAISQNQKQVTNATTTINKVRPKYNGPLGKKRLSLCEMKFKEVSGLLQKSLESGKTGSIRSLKVAEADTLKCISAMNDCKNTWSYPLNGPDQSNPLAESCYNVLGLSYTTKLLIGKLFKNRDG